MKGWVLNKSKIALFAKFKLLIALKLNLEGAILKINIKIWLFKKWKKCRNKLEWLRYLTTKNGIVFSSEKSEVLDG